MLFLQAVCDPCRADCENETVVAHGIDDPDGPANRSMCATWFRRLHIVVSKNASLSLDLMISGYSQSGTVLARAIWLKGEVSVSDDVTVFGVHKQS